MEIGCSGFVYGLGVVSAFIRAGVQARAMIIYINIEKYGNTLAASIPIALSEAYEQHRIKDGDVLMFVAFGAGLAWGAIAWRWNGVAPARDATAL